MNDATLVDLTLESRDGDWGQEEEQPDSSRFAIIRGTDFAEVALRRVGSVPRRYLPNRTSARRTLQANDILIETAGGSPKSPTGRTLLVTQEILDSFEGPVSCASFARFIRVDPLLVDARFVQRQLQNLYNSGVLETFQVQHTGVARFQYTAFSSTYRLKLPPRAEQQAIAEVLGALDDKIAANTALAAAADELIRAEYVALHADLVRVGEIADSPRSGVDPSGVNPDDLYVGLEHVGRRHMWLTDEGRADDVSSTKSRFGAGDILFGKLRPYFHKVVSAPRSGICSTDILVVRSRDRRLSSVLLAALSSDAVIEEVVAASEGTRMPRTSWKDLASVEIRWPTSDSAQQLASRFDSIRDAMLAAVAESRTLAATRDALLPQLMSGKLRVRDAEVAVSEAGA
ncbi:restriction endonuclease subunit S [Microbacterium flavescens]|uniref:restriction endonuclease subunit S n=1 Tax=Microbacterium flavescens TaxID=69366 RepID=UPI001BDE343F|nr:restriction endonuclease subunit S [Microbacterium flavescens]BFF12253.1 hypothetical protein GCM10025699_35560 [Microbacterium flavescens]